MENSITKQLRLSIIVPIYNMEKYLDDCFASLINQDIDDYEIICINDGSRDNSLEIVEKWGGVYPEKFRIITQVNAGHAAARQNGLDIACGKYVWFVDADDYIDGLSLGPLLRTLEESGCDFLTIGYEQVGDETHYSKKESADYQLEFRPKTAVKNACSGNRIFLRELLTKNGIQWDKRLSPNDDTVFLFYVNLHACNKLVLHGINYYHRQNPNSVTKSRGREKTRKAIDSFVLMGEIYAAEAAKRTDGPIGKNILVRLRQTTKALLFFGAVSLSLSERDELLTDLKRRGWYPYSILWSDVPYKISVKRTMMDWCQLLFPFEWYYKLFCRVIKRVPAAKKYMQ